MKCKCLKYFSGTESAYLITYCYNMEEPALFLFPMRFLSLLTYCSNNQLNAKLLYSITICMLHYNPRHVSNINMPIFRRTNCIITASGIVTLCKRLYSMPDESGLLCSLLSSGILYYTEQRVTIPDAVII